MESLPERPLPSRPIAHTVRAWLQWFGILRLAVTAAAVLAVGAGGYWLLRTPAAPVEQRLPMANRGSADARPSATPASVAAGGAEGDPQTTSTAPTSATSAGPTEPSEPAEILVHVAGAVLRPGVVLLRAGARATDAVDAVGGATNDADLDAVNLAAPLRDGDRLYVPHVGQPVPSVVAASGGFPSVAAPPGSAPPTGPVDLNRATVDELDALPGVGPATAAAIVAFRETHGPFSSVDDLLDVRGIGPAKLEAIRVLVTV